MTYDKDKVLDKIIAQLGGCKEPPTVVRQVVGMSEVVDADNLWREGPVRIQVLDNSGLEPVVETPQFIYYTWATSEWVSTAPDVYDRGTNTLTLFGHWKVYRFHVWREREAEEGL